MTTARNVEELARRLTLPEYPRSARYDAQWMVDNAMGPNPLWLLEELSGRLRLEPGMRVLDLGCGKALTSVFLAREFGVRVSAADLWIPPGENWARIQQAGCAELVMPLHAEAHDLPFAAGYFDAVVSVDAFHYFGTDDLYLGYLTEFIAPGGRLGIAVPTVSAEIDRIDAVPERLRDRRRGRTGGQRLAELARVEQRLRRACRRRPHPHHVCPGDRNADRRRRPYARLRHGRRPGAGCVRVRPDRRAVRRWGTGPG